MNISKRSFGFHLKAQVGGFDNLMKKKRKKKGAVYGQGDVCAWKDSGESLLRIF